VQGIAVVANHTSLRGLTVRRNEILDSKATAMYVGCHDGASCIMTDVVIEGNYIHGVTAIPGEVGYGLQVKLNSVATIRDNVIANTKGPGIMVYGARDPAQVSLVERNFVARSGTSSGIVVGGGPVVVRNNVAVGSAEAGIGLEDYGRRGLLRGIVVAHNTVYGNEGGGIAAPPDGRLEARLVNNAVHAPVGKAALPHRAEVARLGNVECPLGVCFVAAEAGDFGFLAAQAGLVVSGPGMPADDYFGQPRGVPPVVGAIERSPGPIPLGLKAPAP
jgi:hypothetical protein